MKVLAVDTSSIVATVALMDESRLIAEFTLNQNKTHSQRLMPMIKELLDYSGMKVDEIDIFAAASGPGSFTGLRIGITTIKAMAYAANKPVVGVVTLDGLAYNIPYFDGIVCPIMDARNEQVYCSVYKAGEGGLPERLSDYMAIPVIELVRHISHFGGKPIFLGDGAAAYRSLLLKELNRICEFATANLCLHRASSIASCAIIKARAGELEDSVGFVPFYLRQSQAERLFGCS